ncbi:MAG: CPBP family intramembrane metalloprotease [Tidjanibacter sp.]|nr:CPBP family intramembrane metalloprotease [Tidjanibacter sp.]
MKKAIIYSVAVCAVSWIAALLFYLSTGYNGTSVSDLEATTKFRSFGMLYMFFPMIVAAVMQLISGEAKFERRRAMNYRLSTKSNPIYKFRPQKSWLVAIGTTLAITALSILFSTLFAEVKPLKEGIMATYANMGIDLNTLPEKDLAMLNKIPSWVMLLGTVLSGILAGVTINALFAYGEEYGWRGYMVTSLKNTKFLPSALLIGFVWGIWHAPLILMGHNGYHNRPLGILLMVIFCILGGIVELYFTCKSGSVWAAVFIHGTINAIAGLGVLMIPDGNAMLTGMTGVAGFLALIFVIGLLYIYDSTHDRIFHTTLGTSLSRKHTTEA